MSPAAPPKVLVADDDASIRLVLSHALTRAGYEVRATGAAGTLLKWAQDGEGDLIVTDVVMPDENVFDVLPRIRRARPSLPIIVMSAQNTLLTAVAAAERGAFEYLPKPFDLEDLVDAARRALAPAGRAARAPARSAREERSPLTGRSAAMQAVYRVIARLVGVDLPVLITGEPGTGKGLAARSLHELGPRRDARFVSLRVAGLPRERLERELVGEDGTGGAVAVAAGGTLHLSEVTELSTAAQARLAAVLDQIEQSGARVRVVATTADDMGRLLAEGRIRRDLHDRLAVTTLRMPPLRERPEDVDDLARGALARTAAAGEPRTLTAGALEALREHPWPGNVRELENVVRRAAALNGAGALSAEMITAELAASAAAPAPAALSEHPVEDHLERAVASAFAGGAPPPGLHDRMVQALERPLLRTALSSSGGNQIRAAELLGLNRNTLRKRLHELGLRSRE